MGNTLQSLKDGDILRKCLASYHNKLKFIKTINRQNDDRFAVEGAKNGGTLLIRNPVEYEVTDGPILNVQDTVETSQTFTVATQKHVGVNFSSLERTMYVDDFVERYVDPAMSKLAAMTEYTVLSGVYKDVFNLSGTPATTPASILSVLNAGVKLSQGLAPESDRHLLFDSLAMAGTVNSVGQYIHKASELEKAFSEKEKRRLIDEMVDKIIRDTKIKMSSNLIERQRDYLLYKLNNELAGRNITREQYLQRNKLTEDALREQYTQVANKQLKAKLIFFEISKKENIKMEEEDLKSEIERIAENAKKEPEEIRAYLERRDMLDNLKEDIIERKIIDFLFSEAQVKEKGKVWEGIKKIFKKK